MAVKFDLNGWECFSERRNSKSYVNYNKTWMVKFDTETVGRKEADLEKEKEVSLKALEIGIKTPKVSDVVMLEDGTLGLIYEYIVGKKSIARACGEDIENVDYYMERFAKSAKDFHSHICDPRKFDAYEDRIRRMIEEFGYLNDEQKKKAYALLDNTEKKYTALHGDFHTGNFIMTKDKEFAIDLGSISYGNEIYDISYFYYFMHFMPWELTAHVFHCDGKYNRKMWECFAKHYYDLKTDEEVKALDKKMSKYALVSFFAILESVKPGPEIKECIDKNFDKVFSD